MDKLLKLWIASTMISSNAKKYICDNFKTANELKETIDKKNNDLPNIINTGRLLECYNIIINENLLSYIEKNNINIILQGDLDYPLGLLHIYSPPFSLFYKGDISKINDRKSLSVVGSRRCSKYGEESTTCIINQLKNYNINVVSGLAVGIDSIAHRAALKNNINTVAVLGSGIDYIYPKINTSLYNDILNSGGCIISEFPLGTKPYPKNFPIRNRIISGIGDLLLVTEAGEKSGTLITAGLALDQGKEVMAVPGSIFSKGSCGTNKLLKDGAHVYTEVQDILDIWNISKIYIDNNDEMSIFYTKIEELLNIIDENPIHIDDIIKRTNIDINQLYKLLFELQVKEEILCLSGNFYVKVNKKMKNAK